MPDHNPSPKRVVFLDRDGTINVDHGYVHAIAQWQFLPGAPEALRRLQEAGYVLAVTTNQSGVASGRFPESAILALHAHMTRELAAYHVSFAAVVYCPHAREGGCGCRKPEPGLARQVEAIVGPIDYGASWVIGDKPSDVAFGQNIGTRTAFIRGQHTVAESRAVPADMHVDSLLEFAQLVTASR